MRRTRRRHVPPDLTSLFDVLFIVIFAALIRAAAAQHAVAVAAPSPTPPTPPKPLDPASLHARAITTFDRDLAARDTVIARIRPDGTLVALETRDKTTTLDVPLLEHSIDPDVKIAYLGERSAELRICRIAALHLGVPDLTGKLVIIAPADKLAELPHALFDGLRRDVDRCLAEQHGLAVVVEP